jgi:hypothetical protein
VTEIEGLIRFWEAKLKYNRAYFSPSEAAMIERTVKLLKELNTKKEVGV